jgi:selenocysteine-specific elongation factor
MTAADQRTPTRPARPIATAGHVDHGKSTLVEALTGTNPDRFAEERARGMTIDLGFAHTTLPDNTPISFVDVPGHVRFVGNMLAGVGDIDACVFIVAATEAWKPQSEEHLRILELLGVRHGIVALTKVDLVDDDHRELARMDIADRVAGTFLDGAPIIDVAAPSGHGLVALRTELATLVGGLADPVDRQRPRLWVDRAFAARGAGTVVTGTLSGGALGVDEHVHIGPDAVDVRIRRIQHLGADVERLAPGGRVALNLVGVERQHAHRGDAVFHTNEWHLTRTFDAELRVLDGLDHRVSRRGAYVLHTGSGEWPAQMRVLGPDTLAPGETGAVRLHLAAPLPLVFGDRFVLRESGRRETVGGGTVLDVAPIRRASVARPDRSIDRIIAEHQLINVDELARLTGERRPADVGHWVVDPAVLQARRTELAQRIEAAAPGGLDAATLDEPGRQIALTLDDVVMVDGRLRRAEAPDPLADHPVLALLKAGGVQPPTPDGVPRDVIRQLIARGWLFERDSVLFHQVALDQSIEAVRSLLATRPDGFTVAEFRDALSISRKYALPLVNELDARGLTRRRDDYRIPGPRLHD